MTSSRIISSQQSGIHRQLQAVVTRHLENAWQKPISSFSPEVFRRVEGWLALDDRPFILDSGCGTGQSTVRLAERFPQHKVLGFDRSAARLGKLAGTGNQPENCFTIRARAEDLWRQLVSARLKPVRHYLLFPNPYPKPAQLNQRWHGSPAFRYLLALGGQLEVRSNWQIYVDEFAAALNFAADIPASVESYSPNAPVSPFEKKYQNSGHMLWRLSAQLGDRGTN